MKASRLIDYLGHMEQAAADALDSSRYTHRCPDAACCLRPHAAAESQS